MREHLSSFVRRDALRRAIARSRIRTAAPSPAQAPFELRLPSAPGEARRPGRSVTMPAPGRHWLLARLADDGIAGYEPETVACFLAALAHAPAGAVLDVGANVGLYSILAGATSDRPVYGFEPTPDLAGLMRRVAADNGLGFHTEQIAVGADRGTATLYLSDVTDASNSLAAGFRPSSRHLDVEVETLDGWCERKNVIPGLIKIDTESTEPDVIRGAREIIGAHQPWIFCEVLRGRVEEPLMELMRPLPYFWYHLAGDPPYEPRDTIVGDDTHQHLMWLFAPDRIKDEFWASVSGWRASL
ncbi:MAG TPA: FkbM family methyltransferase [Streptosporangiaceae bacterium]|nr:FkbM family methyltransferase [Streptosporangiaceae bacterium]